MISIIKAIAKNSLLLMVVEIFFTYGKVTGVISVNYYPENCNMGLCPFQVYFVCFCLMSVNYYRNMKVWFLEFPAPKKLTTRNAVRDKQTTHSPFIDLTN